jgi:lysyl-tRNA synthetase class 2
MVQAIDQLIKVRKEKLAKIRKLGINPYPARCQRDQKIDQARKAMGKKVSVVGRLRSWRGHGKLQFADFEDESGKIQLVFKVDKLDKKKFDFLKLLDVGDFLAVQGEVFKTKTGEVSVLVKDFQLLAKSVRPLPDKWRGLKDVEERYRKRHLDILMNPEVKKIFEIRAKVVSAMREFLDKRGYLEVETPFLQSIYGGGLARPFKTYHNALGIPLYLRISTELYLKRLIAAGFEKVYEIAKVFRNEGIDKDHNPEFVMVETMEAYVDYRYNMELVEKMIEYAVKKAVGKTKVKYQGQEIDFKTPWKRVSMVEAVKKETGVDFSKIKDIKEALKVAKKLGLELEEYHKSAVGLILAAAFEEKVEHTLIQPTIIYDFPVETSPLSKKCEDDPRYVERWEHYVAGKEASNNYSELNDPVELAERFRDERKKERLGDQEAHQTDEDFIEAMEYGMPPTSGIGPGIDRLVMVITNSQNLRDVILFPTLKPLGGVIQDSGLRGDMETRKRGKIQEKYDYKEKKITAIVNADLPKGKALNALAHLAFSAGRNADNSWMGKEKIFDAGGSFHVGIAKYPFVILKASKQKIKEIRKKARSKGIFVVDFPQEMFETGLDYELVKVLSKTKEAKITYHAIVLRGNSKDINDLTSDLKLLK